MRIEFGFVDVWKGDVGLLRRDDSFDRMFGGKVVVLAAQRVLSLSKTKARIEGMRCLETRCGPRFSGRCVKVGIVR